MGAWITRRCGRESAAEREDRCLEDDEVRPAPDLSPTEGEGGRWWDPPVSERGKRAGWLASWAERPMR